MRKLFIEGTSPGPDGKPRLRKNRKGNDTRVLSKDAQREKRAKSQFKSTALRQDLLQTGKVMMRDHGPSGSVSGLVIGASGPQGGISVNPLTSLSYMIRRRMQPIRLPSCTVTDASGKVIAVITVDPVTGRRTRTPVEPS